MRDLVQPPPSMHCARCNGELLFKMIVPGREVIDMDSQIFVCSKCGHEQSRRLIHDPYVAHTAASVPRNGA